MANLTRVESTEFEGCVVYLENKTGAVYVSTSEVARLVKGDKGNVSKFLKARIQGVYSGYILEAEIPTEGGFQRGVLWGKELILDAVAHFNPQLLRVMAGVTLEAYYKLPNSVTSTNFNNEAQKALGSWHEARQLTISVHSNFVNAYMLKKHSGSQVHDLITKLITGYSASDARKMPLVEEGSDATVGLNHVISDQNLAWIAQAKANYCRYKKGTWQEQCLRAVDATEYTIGT